MANSKRKVISSQDKLLNTSGPSHPGTIPNDPEDYEWSHERFKERFKAKIIKLIHEENEDHKYVNYEWMIEFDLIGIDCAIANALRRILISEVPSMAIEKVFVHNNTSFIIDEVLAHRLGLVPLRADARPFKYRSDASAEPSDEDTLEFELKVKCPVKKDGQKTGDIQKNLSVYSKDIKWIPLGKQTENLEEEKVRPVLQKILLDKLKPGQELNLKLHAVKGIGRDHAKFSPVATASYRMLPDIKLLKEVKGEAAVRLQKCFSPGVIEIEEVNGEKVAVVADPRNDACSRIVLRHDDLKDCVQMSRVQDHFIFKIESVGALPPEELFLEAVAILQGKCQKYLNELEATITNAKNY